MTGFPCNYKKKCSNNTTALANLLTFSPLHCHNNTNTAGISEGWRIPVFPPSSRHQSVLILKHKTASLSVGRTKEVVGPLVAFGIKFDSRAGKSGASEGHSSLRATGWSVAHPCTPDDGNGPAAAAAWCRRPGPFIPAVSPSLLEFPFLPQFPLPKGFPAARTRSTH